MFSDGGYSVIGPAPTPRGHHDLSRPGGRLSGSVRLWTKFAIGIRSTSDRTLDGKVQRHSESQHSVQSDYAPRSRRRSGASASAGLGATGTQLDEFVLCPLCASASEHIFRSRFNQDRSRWQPEVDRQALRYCVTKSQMPQSNRDEKTSLKSGQPRGAKCGNFRGYVSNSPGRKSAFHPIVNFFPFPLS